MISSIDASSERFLEALRTLNTRLTKTQQQVSSGKRLLAPSDGPDSVSAVLQIRADLSRLDQVATNLIRTRAETDTAEQALQSAVKLFDRVRALGMTGAGTQQTAETRQAIADELAAILEQFIGLANTEVDGRFIFSGDSDQAPAFLADPAQSPPFSAYQGATATRRALHPTGTTFAVSMSADDIFANADPTRNVIQSIETLRQALLGGDETAMRDALAPLAQVSAHLNSALTFYGHAQMRVQQAWDTTAHMKVRLSTELSELQDADITEAIVEMQQLAFQREAALSVRGAMPRNSLFDYLR